MFFGQLRERVDQRLVDYGRSGRRDTVLSEQALAEAAELWQAAQPADPERSTPEDNQRLASACYSIGRLHVVRCHALRDEGAEYLSEVARAVAPPRTPDRHPSTATRNPSPALDLVATAPQCPGPAGSTTAPRLRRQIRQT